VTALPCYLIPNGHEAVADEKSAIVDQLHNGSNRMMMKELLTSKTPHTGKIMMPLEFEPGINESSDSTSKYPPGRRTCSIKEMLLQMQDRLPWKVSSIRHPALRHPVVL